MDAGAAAVALVREEPVSGADVALLSQPVWRERLPWLVQGITSGDADMSLFGSSPAGNVVNRWLTLRDEVGCAAVVHARQVHAASVIAHEQVCRGILIAGDGDGHATRLAGVLLTVSVADCVPIYVAAPDARAIALLHGGWRGVAAGILENGIDLLARRYGARPAELLVHMGPAICGNCFEVGAEVPPQLGLPAPDGPTSIDLRGVLARRAERLGVPAANISISTHCTRCGDSPFFSHRGGCRERQLALLGIRGAAH